MKQRKRAAAAKLAFSVCIFLLVVLCAFVLLPWQFVPYTVHQTLHMCKKFEQQPPVLRHLPNSKCQIFYFPGRGRAVEFAFWHLQQLQAISKCNVIPFQNPGCYHKSDATWTDALPFVRNRMKNGTVHYLMGASFGTAVVAYVHTHLTNAEWEQFGGAILENPFTSVGQVIGHHYLGHWVGHLLSPAVEYLLGEELNWNFTERRIEYVCNDPNWACVVYDFQPSRVPRYLILTSEKDEMIPPYMSEEIKMRLAPFFVIHRILPGANHGDAPAHRFYSMALNGYFGNKPTKGLF